MSFFNKNLPQPIHIFKRTGGQDNPQLDIKEDVLMTSNRIILKEIPVKYYKVMINDSTSNYFYEKDSIVDLSENEFFVDYTYGIITFHESVVGKLLHFTYKGEGFILLSADRIFTHDEHGFVAETLQELVDKCKSGVEEYRQLIEWKVQVINQKIIDAQIAIDNANNAATDARTKTADYQAVVDSTKMIYKEMVATFANIATTYPTPEIGWVVPVEATKLRYRWDGFAWICLGSSEPMDGFNVFIGSMPPENDNLLWINAPEHDVGTYGRVMASETEPENDAFIWWVID
ncbi:hypothetical protein [Priestia aryabhattai]|uniref:hypothetical protein n=1 Tax=Priestia aryabhattai TaxID=412384 RepID=UPI0015F4E756|nr:hypothetical protein [Priestia aryabhattai]